MPKGKKFDAAEKHFEKKRVEYERQIKALQTRVTEQRTTIEQAQAQISALTAENQQLKVQNAKLLEYAQLAPEDIRGACEKDKKLAECCDLMRLAASYTSWEGADPEDEQIARGLHKAVSKGRF